MNRKDSRSFTETLRKPRRAWPLAVFRIGFALLMLYHMASWFPRAAFYEDPFYLRFPFQGLEWWPVLPAAILKVLSMVGVLSAVLVLIGYRFRIASAILVSIYCYLFFLDSFYYNNHYYLLILIGFLLSWTEADKVLSVSSKSKGKRKYIPYWNYLILQLQFAFVYFFGGIAKINVDWMNGDVMSGMTDHEALIMILTWGGLFFDLLIPFFLLWRRTRLSAMVLVVLFNVSNHFLFGDIAAFPLLACLGLFCFLEGKAYWPQVADESLIVSPKIKLRSKVSAFTRISLYTYFVIQLLLPIRPYLIPGSAEWTGQGHYFSWRMKSFRKEVSLEAFAFDRSKGVTLYPINTGLDDYRIQRMGRMPHQVMHFARYLKDKIDRIDGSDSNIGVSIDYRAALNGHEEKQVVGKEIDLSSVSFQLWRRNDWMKPL